MTRFIEAVSGEGNGETRIYANMIHPRRLYLSSTNGGSVPRLELQRSCSEEFTA
jgi:hypothetical protein